MAPYIIGGILIVLGALLAILVPIKTKNKNIEIKFMQTTSIQDLKELLEANKEAGLEGYRHYVELKGRAKPVEPVKTPFSETDVAYYSADLYQVYEEVKGSNNKSGPSPSVKKSESLITNDKSSKAIALTDSSSSQEIHIGLNQPGLQLDALKTYDQFEPLNNSSRDGFFRNFRYNPMGARTLGFRMVEKTIPLAQDLYVLGEAWLESDRIKIGKPWDKKLPFIVSVKDKRDIVQSNKSGANVALVFGILLALAGILLIIFL